MFASAQPPEVSDHAMEILRGADLVDLHVDGMIPHRLVGYDLNRHHEGPPLAGRFFGHLDFPRAMENGLAGAMWSITTNPFRTPGGRWRAFLRNCEALRAQVAGSDGKVVVATNMVEYREGRAEGKHVVLPAVQGGNALEAAPAGLSSVPGNFLTRVTLVHLTNSIYGVTSSPFAFHRKGGGLSGAGRDLVRDLDAHRVFVDLAHINPAGFWDAVEVHDPSLPLLATHTGVNGVYSCWRNLDDAQIKAVADTGGVVGIIFHQGFLARGGASTDGRIILDHMEHIIRVAGEDHVGVGSDYDGAIIPPVGLRHSPCYPRMVQWMLDRGWSDLRIQKILGGNFLRCFADLRG